MMNPRCSPRARAKALRFGILISGTQMLPAREGEGVMQCIKQI